MRRNKIKLKYLNMINCNNCDLENNVSRLDNDINLCNIVFDTTSKIICFAKALGIILLMFFWSYIPLILLELFNIDYNSLSMGIRLIYVILCDLSFIAFIIYIYRKDFFKDFKNFFNNKFFDNFKVSLKYWAIGMLIMISSNIIIGIISNGAIASNEESVRELIDKLPIYMLLHLVIYAPVTEELIFRRSFRDAFNNKYLYALVTGLIFGGMHVVGSITDLTQALYIIPYSALGIAFGLLYKKTNNIFSTISIHAMHNFLTLLLYLGSAGL